jgi:hypothetical protein
MLYLLLLQGKNGYTNAPEYYVDTYSVCLVERLDVWYT